MIGTIYRWPLKYSFYKLYVDMRATKLLTQSCTYHNACIHTIRKEISALVVSLKGGLREPMHNVGPQR